jgi:murein DD-endopeptidase MepM/ murein hydrolase activator NlpD
MRAFARGVRTGARVRIGQTIGYVGMTGLATAPHLHFEVLVDGVQHDPRQAFARKTGAPIALDQRPGFEAQRSTLVALLDASPGGTPRTGP